MSAPPTLSIGYFEEFKSCDQSILIWGDANGLRALAERLRGLCSAITKEILLYDLPDVRTVGDAKIKLEIVERSTGMFRLENSSDAEFHWGLSPSRANHFADLITLIAETKDSGHHYLDTNRADETTVIVSIGEYPETFA